MILKIHAMKGAEMKNAISKGLGFPFDTLMRIPQETR